MHIHSIVDVSKAEDWASLISISTKIVVNSVSCGGVLLRSHFIKRIHCKVVVSGQLPSFEHFWYLPLNPHHNLILLGGFWPMIDHGLEVHADLAPWSD